MSSLSFSIKEHVYYYIYYILFYLLSFAPEPQQRYRQNHIIEYYDKLKTQPYDKYHKVASIACVNKLLTLLFYLITHNMHYDFRLTA
ncbi:hypothetical protein FORC13_p125 (plasmid) [Bacillus cereus]|nr:hypothetical protein FORC13_p125 [Bacillus cereus]